MRSNWRVHLVRVHRLGIVSLDRRLVYSSVLRIHWLHLASSLHTWVFDVICIKVHILYVIGNRALGIIERARLNKGWDVWVTARLHLWPSSHERNKSGAVDLEWNCVQWVIAAEDWHLVLIVSNLRRIKLAVKHQTKDSKSQVAIVCE